MTCAMRWKIRDDEQGYYSITLLILSATLAIALSVFWILAPHSFWAFTSGITAIG